MKPIQEVKQHITEHINQNFLEEFRLAAQEEVEDALGECGYTQTCINCRHFDEPKEHCMFFKPPSRPPARVIAFGCDAFSDASEALADGVQRLIPPEPEKRVDVPVKVGNRVAIIRTGFDDLDDDIPF